MRNAGLDETQAGITIAGRNINNFRHADDTTFFFPPFSEFLVIVFTVLRGQACYRGLTAKPKLAWSLTVKMRTQCVSEETSTLEAGGTVVLG